MSSKFALPSVVTQNAMPDHACSMTHHTGSIVARAWFNVKPQNPYEFLNHLAKFWKRLTQSTVCNRSQGASGGPDSGQLFCTICAQLALVLCKPLQVVAENKSTLTVQPHPLSEERLSWQQVFGASCATLPVCSSLLCCKIWTQNFTAVLFCQKPGAFQVILPHAVRAQHNSLIQPMLSPLFRSDSSFGFDNT